MVSYMMYVLDALVPNCSLFLVYIHMFSLFFTEVLDVAILAPVSVYMFDHEYEYLQYFLTALLLVTLFCSLGALFPPLVTNLCNLDCLLVWECCLIPVLFGLSQHQWRCRRQGAGGVYQNLKRECPPSPPPSPPPSSVYCLLVQRLKVSFVLCTLICFVFV